ncbi:glycosyltransferase family 2 protein [Thiomicrospira microaerophila]|uniref:glycosyltransferase family 2 protein n=1 Tax=Thiomicrospira microaerophila TaxID=406020 RepID=UPI0020108DFB|nr:glycosyltransferase family 2 protein [Thiomicrospira microaerophila]UQB43275.1 glycosyltransferase family 2 protein [Thiomicrospira microaerophila]
MIIKHKKKLLGLIKAISRITTFPITLKPVSGLTKNAANCWQAKDNDPQFVFKRRKLSVGWYLVELEIEHEDKHHHQAKLYPDYGDGITEQAAIALPLMPGKVTGRVVYIEKNLKKLRLDPTETAGEFSIKRLLISRIPSQYALFRICKRLAHHHPEYTGMAIKNIKDKLNTEAEQTNEKLRELALQAYAQTFSLSNSDLCYQTWIETVENPKLKKTQGILKPPSYNPTISILLPAYNTEPQHLAQCIQSVIVQTYPNWQLIIVDDASNKKQHIEVIKTLQNQDNRILFKQRNRNGHISQASNDALEHATGEYTLLLDHDDLLAPHALAFFIDTLNKQPDAKLIYADEDKVDEQNQRHNPHFKPDWNPDLLLSQNYIGHPVVYQTDRLKQIGGFRLGYEGSQDHDLLLRYTQGLAAKDIIHIHWILYHWRSHQGSTANNTDTKNYTTQAGIKALQNSLQQQNTKATVIKGVYANTYRINWPVPNPAPLVSLLIPTRNGHDILKMCLDSILNKTTYAHYEIIILDNQTTCTKTKNLFTTLSSKHPNIRVVKWDKPFNYSAINNFGVEHAQGEIIGLINNDIEVISPDWLNEMVSQAVRPEIGCVGAKLYYPNDTIQHAGVILGIGGVAGHSHKYFSKKHPGYFTRLNLTQNFSAVTAACLIVKKSIYKHVGGLDEHNLTVAFNDVDFCLKVREAGYRNLFTPWAELYHHESISRGAENTSAKRKRFAGEVSFMKTKWKSALHHDPAYNRNLTLEHENFTLRNH